MSVTPSRRSAVPSQSHSSPSASGQRPCRTYKYQPPEAPLTIEAQRKLTALLSSSDLRALRTHLQHAADKLTHSGGEVNERLADARGRYEKEKELRRRRGSDDLDDKSNEEYKRLAQAENRVEAITAQMEEKTRMIIDSRVRLQGLTDAVGEIEKEEHEAAMAAIGTRQTRGQRSRRRHNEDGDGDEDPQDDDYEDTQERDNFERNAQNPPSSRLDAKVVEETSKWNDLSLTERYGICSRFSQLHSNHMLRYAGDNTYIGFYRMVHDSKFPSDDVPPLPHSSTWFEHMEDQTRSRIGASTRSHQNHAPSDDDEIAIARERISLKCPLTLMTFVDPVTSTKCPHSFEREAIMDMIKQSRTTIAPPASRRGQGRVRVVKCPVCTKPLSADDLQPDAVLLRKVRRAQELEEREEDDDHLGDGRRTKESQARVELDSDDESDDAMDVDVLLPSQRVKAEPLSQAAPVSVEEDEEEEEATVLSDDGDVADESTDGSE